MLEDLVDPLLDDHHLAMRGELREFARERIGVLPIPSDDAAARLQAREILALLGEAGWCRYAVAEDYGGRSGAPDLRACCLIREALAWASPLADAIFAIQCLGAVPFDLIADVELCRRLLPALAAGRCMPAFAMTEAGAGSDVAGIATRARRDGDGYVLDGRKTLISNAGLADVYLVFAATDPAAGRGGLSCFVVDGKTPGLRFVGAQVMSVPHPLGEIALEACRVPLAARLGAEGEGFELGMRTLDRLRATVAAAACGMAARALDEALAHARRRRQFGRPLADFQLIREKLARMVTELAASRLLTFRAARDVDRSAETVTLGSAMAKSFATEAAQRIIDDAVQILGGSGVLADSAVDRLYRAVRALRIYEGTTEIQHLVIARELLEGG